jgi:PhnB protein
MKRMNVYLNFNGHCREAMNFYKDCLGGELEMRSLNESPMEVPEEAKDYIMHAVLTHPAFILMASDGMPDQPVSNGTSVSLSLECESQNEIDSSFSRMSAGGTITMPLQDTFWGARFGMITDKFGIQWLFNFEHPKN